MKKAMVAITAAPKVAPMLIPIVALRVKVGFEVEVGPGMFDVDAGDAVGKDMFGAVVGVNSMLSLLAGAEP